MKMCTQSAGQLLKYEMKVKTENSKLSLLNCFFFPVNEE